MSTPPLPIVVVGHNPTAALLVVNLAKRGEHVLWVHHIRLPGMKTHVADDQVVKYETIPPGFFRKPPNTPATGSDPNKPLADTPLSLQALWKRHHLRIHPQQWQSDVLRDFPDTPLQTWLRPTMPESHFSKQLAHALAVYLCQHHAPRLQSPSTLETLLKLQGGESGGCLRSELMETIEQDLHSKQQGPVEISQAFLQDLILQNGKVWGVVLADHHGVRPCRQVILTDHSLACAHLHESFKNTVTHYRFNFCVGMKSEDVPSGFSGESLLLPFHDLPVEGPNAVFLKRMSLHRAPLMVLGVRMDFPYQPTGVSEAVLRHAIYHSLLQIEERAFPLLPQRTVFIDPPLLNAATETNVFNEKTSFVYYSFAPRENAPESLLPGLMWYGPEHWGSLGWHTYLNPVIDRIVSRFSG